MSPDFLSPAIVLLHIKHDSGRKGLGGKNRLTAL